MMRHVTKLGCMMLAAVSIGVTGGCSQDPEAAVQRARKVQPPPETVPCRVTGGGQIEWGESPDSFGGNAQPFRTRVGGEWNHVTHDGLHFHGRPDAIECWVDANDEEPPSAGAAAIQFSGVGSFGPYRSCAFVVYIEDHGEPGAEPVTPDYYEISIDCPGSEYDYYAGDTLLHGNLQLHAVPPGHLPR